MCTGESSVARYVHVAFTVIMWALCQLIFVYKIIVRATMWYFFSRIEWTTCSGHYIVSSVQGLSDNETNSRCVFWDETTTSEWLIIACSI